MSDFDWWVGIDWGHEKHAVCVLFADGRQHSEFLVPQKAEALHELANRLASLSPGNPGRVAIAIETPEGPVVATLVDRELAVFSINPKQVDRFRDRFTVAGAKDDRRDALVLASSLRTDQQLFRAVRLRDAETTELRELVRMHQELSEERTALGNRAEDLLRRYFPQVLELGSIHDEPWLWALIARAPSPREASSLSLAKIEKILTSHRIRRTSAKEVKAILSAPALHVAPGVAQACRKHIGQVLPRLRLVQEHSEATLRDMESLLRVLEQPEPEPEPGKNKHRDAAILRSLPGVGTIVGAAMLAEAFQPLRQRDYQALRAYAGVAPVTKRSGKSLSVQQRQQCNPIVRNALFHWASVAIRWDDVARAQYARLRARGHSYARALRGVGDRLLAMLIAMLRSGSLYDSARRKPLDAT
jgi:transposase